MTTDSPRSVWRRLGRALGPDGAFTIAALLILASMVLALGGALEVPPGSVFPFVLLALSFLVVSAATRLPALVSGDLRSLGRSQVRALRLWAPFVIVYLCYRILRGSLLAIIDHGGVQDQLLAIDRALLGESPAWALEPYTTRWMTELLAGAYATMFALPVLILLVLYARDHDRAFRRAALALVSAFYVGFLLFVLVPAKSPRDVYEFSTALHGYGFYEASARAWVRLQQITFDAFPSMHTAISTIALVHARRLGPLLSPTRPRLFFRAYLPVVLLLQFATLYLRQHYFVDLVAGWGVAALCLWMAPRIDSAWTRRFAG
jgi:membrane-associated phospholipid phosphatase